jgi:dihydroxyacetone kinase-like protein
VEALVEVIDTNAMLLSEIDGAIGDGDHGVNMRKGFVRARQRFGPETDLAAGLETIGDTLLGEIGGSMGPLYGTFFLEMARVCEGHEEVDANLFGSMLDAGIEALLDIGGAKVGDKTLVDVMVPAREAYHALLAAGGAFAVALEGMARAADEGRDSTRDLVARVGRASRLGERSRGALDAGATSCALLLNALASSIRELLSEAGAEARPA